MCETVVHQRFASYDKGALRKATYRPVEKEAEIVLTDYHKSYD